MTAPVNDLIAPAQAGEQPAFQSIVEAHQVLVFNVCLRMLGDWHEAQDLTQDVFFKAYKALPQLRGDAKVSTWLYRIAVNLCLNHQRRRRRERWLSLDWLFEQSGGEQAAGIPATEATPSTALAQQDKEGLVQGGHPVAAGKAARGVGAECLRAVVISGNRGGDGMFVGFGGIAAAPGQGESGKGAMRTAEIIHGRAQVFLNPCV